MQKAAPLDSETPAVAPRPNNEGNERNLQLKRNTARMAAPAYKEQAWPSSCATAPGSKSLRCVHGEGGAAVVDEAAWLTKMNAAAGGSPYGVETSPQNRSLLAGG